MFSEGTEPTATAVHQKLSKVASRRRKALTAPQKMTQHTQKFRDLEERRRFQLAVGAAEVAGCESQGLSLATNWIMRVAVPMKMSMRYLRRCCLLLLIHRRVFAPDKCLLLTKIQVEDSHTTRMSERR
jgi:hypothetical protein